MTVRLHGDVTVIDCDDRIVVGELDALQNVARSAIDGTGRVILNLARVRSIDSTGLGMLAALCLRARKQSGDVKLVAPSPKIQKVLDITMMGHVFQVFPSVEEALAAFSKD